MSAIAVIIPTLNEEAHIGRLLSSILSHAPADLSEVIISDGGSQDGTRDIVDEVARSDKRVRLIANSKRVQAAGCNLAARSTGPDVDILVRLDAHSDYPADYVARAASVLRETGADSVVVRLKTQGRGCFQRAVAWASNSKLGTGGAAHRVGGSSGWIDHGHHAAFWKSTFLRLDGYDETFPANEDAEYDARLLKTGGRIWFDASLDVTYWPRENARALARQYFRYGLGRAKNMRKSRDKLKLRQMAAPGILVFCIVCALGGFFVPWLWLGPLAYILSAALYGAALGLKSGDACAAFSGPCAVVMHLSWAAGFWQGMLSSRGR